MLFQWAAVTFSIHTPFKVLFFVKNIGQWNSKSGPKAAYGNFAMRKKNSGSLKKKWKREGRNGSHFAHTHTHSAKLVVRITVCINIKTYSCGKVPLLTGSTTQTYHYSQGCNVKKKTFARLLWRVVTKYIFGKLRPLWNQKPMFPFERKTFWSAILDRKMDTV